MPDRAGVRAMVDGVGRPVDADGVRPEAAEVRDQIAHGAAEVERQLATDIEALMEMRREVGELLPGRVEDAGVSRRVPGRMRSGRIIPIVRSRVLMPLERLHRDPRPELLGQPEFAIL
jgi:hypothetical protein